MAGSFSMRLAAASGWIALLGIVGLLIALPTAVAGNPPSAWTPIDDAMRYFRHPEFTAVQAIWSVFVAAIPIVPLGLGIRNVIHRSADARGQALADVGLILLIVALPVYVVSGALGAALVDASNGDPATFGVLFRLYQLLYNGGADVLEGAWIAAFSLAAITSSMPRWLGWLGVVAGLSRWVKAFMPVVTLPEGVAMVSGLLFVAWLIAIVFAVTLEARRPSAVGSPAPFPAA